MKYIGIVLANLILLFILLTIWIDEFELEFNSGIIISEFLKLLGISILALILLRVLVYIFKIRKIKSLKKKMGISALVVILISSYFYFNYAHKIYLNKIANIELRKGIISKIKPYEGTWNGSIAENLTAREYKEITKFKWFPKLPEEANNISYEYEYEGFLPDYSFSLSYDLPLNAEVKTMDYEEDTFSKSRSFKIIGNVKRVTYSEFLW